MLEKEVEAVIENELDRVRALQVASFAEVSTRETELLAAMRRVRDAERRLEAAELQTEAQGNRLLMLARAFAVAKESPGLVQREDTGYTILVDGDHVFVLDPEKL
jgi:hypothetical protein